MMRLFFRKSGSGDPIVILHGLYGSSDNWHSISRKLAEEFTVYTVDQRNHGQSPHHPEHNYEVLGEDLKAFILEQALDKPIILGHSMGGKTALAFGMKYPEMVKKMIVVDISPLGYSYKAYSAESSSHERIIYALQSIDPALLASREEADAILQKTIAPAAIRQFLLKNLKRSTEGFYWALNIQALAENLPAIYSGILPENMNVALPQFPLIFIKGEYSVYIRKKDEEAIHQYFPWAEIEVIPEAGHWVHAEQPEAFLHAVRNFIRKDK
jgi:esterase